MVALLLLLPMLVYRLHCTGDVCEWREACQLMTFLCTAVAAVLPGSLANQTAFVGLLWRT